MAVSPGMIERIDEQMRQAREARERGDPAAQGDVVFRAKEPSEKPVFTYTGEIGGERADVTVVPQESVWSQNRILARRVKFTQARVRYGIEENTLAFLVPVRLDEQGIFIEVNARDCRGRCSIREMSFDPCAPFKGDKATRRMLDKVARFVPSS